MKRLLLIIITLFAASLPALAPAPCGAANLTTLTLGVDSPAFVFSPGNWTGDSGRGGKIFRQTWNPGAYFRVTWETKNSKPTAKLTLDVSTHTSKWKAPQIACNIDGVWKSRIPCSKEIVIEDIAGAGKHELSVYLTWSEQKERWGGDGKSGLNVLRVTGLQVDADSKPVVASPVSKWALIVGDSITEGSGASELSAYSHLTGQALQTQGYEYGLSACGWSGWLGKGDNPPGDVPGYYVVTNSVNGAGGQYDDKASRWNKIDGNGHSLLDARGHISAYGETGQEPALILINYGTNDALRNFNPGDIRASIAQCLAALRKSAPDAHILLLIPFGQYHAAAIRESVETHRKALPSDNKVSIIDLGPSLAKTLAAKNGIMGSVHPSDKGHANLAAKIIPQVLMALHAPVK